MSDTLVFGCVLSKKKGFIILIFV